MKHFWFSYVCTLLFISILAVLLAWFFQPIVWESSVSQPLSPLPGFLTRTKNNQVSTMDLFLPVIELFTRSHTPQISARAVISYDTTSRKTLYSKNPKTQLPMASLTKIMTAIVGLENRRLDNTYLVAKEDLVGENAMGLSEGEKLTFDDLLYGLVLNSGNDAAEVIASNYPSGRNAFIEALNDKAKALGLKNSHFTNPSGLEGDGDQYSTAYDLMVMTRYALEKFPQFRKVSQAVTYEIPKTATHKAFFLSNETNLLTSYPGVKGVKTGFTPEAGLCLVTYLEYKDHNIIVVLLGSENRREEMKEILDYSLKQLGIAPPKHT